MRSSIEDTRFSCVAENNVDLFLASFQRCFVDVDDDLQGVDTEEEAESVEESEVSVRAELHGEYDIDCDAAIFGSLYDLKS